MVLGYKPRFSTPDLKGRLPVHAGAVSKRLDTMEMWPGIFAFCGGVVGWAGMRWDNNSTNNSMSYSLNSLKGGYIRDYIGDYYRGY